MSKTLHAFFNKLNESKETEYRPHLYMWENINAAIRQAGINEQVALHIFENLKDHGIVESKEFYQLLENDDYDEREYDYEGDMLKDQLLIIADAAEEMHDTLEDDENVPEWIQSKITRAQDYIVTARDWMMARDTEDEDMEDDD